MMGTKDFAAALDTLRQQVTTALEGYLPAPEDALSPLLSAMGYSLLPPGKCIRGILLLLYNRLCGGDDKTAMPFACALEMLHTYSLIHDDLPCMDNDDVRRGRAANHKVYGDDMALLAGSSLLSLAFETVLNPEHTKGIPPNKTLRAAYELAFASGAKAMAGGQAMDIRANPAIDLDILYARKTGALFHAAAAIAAALSDAPPEQTAALRRHAAATGLVFQIADDVLDEDHDVYTMLGARGEAWCREQIAAKTARAIDALGVFEGSDALLLTEITRMLAFRDH